MQTHTFSPTKYEGLWYEVARLPLKWETPCVASTATYKWEPASRVLDVTNTCQLSDGTALSRHGTAARTETQGTFLLEFNDGLPSDGASEYIVHATNYVQFSVVGSRSKEFLWILSREPNMQSCVYNYALRKAKALRYPTEKLIVSRPIVPCDKPHPNPPPSRTRSKSREKSARG